MQALTDPPIHAGHSTITRGDLFARLLALPLEIAEQEQEVLAAAQAVQLAKGALADREAALLLGTQDDGNPLIFGKNAEQRAAMMHQATTTEREDVETAQAIVDRERISLSLLTNELSALRSICRLLAAGGVE